MRLVEALPGCEDVTSTSRWDWWRLSLVVKMTHPPVDETGGGSPWLWRWHIHQKMRLVEVLPGCEDVTSTSRWDWWRLSLVASLIYWWMCHLHNQGEPPPVSSTGGYVIFTMLDCVCVFQFGDDVLRGDDSWEFPQSPSWHRGGTRTQEEVTH